MGAKRRLNGTLKVKTQTDTLTDKSTYRKHRPDSLDMWKLFVTFDIYQHNCLRQIKTHSWQGQFCEIELKIYKKKKKQKLHARIIKKNKIDKLGNKETARNTPVLEGVITVLVLK